MASGKKIKKILDLSIYRENTKVFEGTIDNLRVRIIGVFDTYNKRIFESVEFPGFSSKGELSRIREYEPMCTFLLHEKTGFTLNDMQKNALSDITKKYYDTIEITSQTIERAFWDKSRKTFNIVIFNYKDEPKETISMKAKTSSKNYYRITIRFEDVRKKPETINEVLSILNTKEALVHSSDPSWLFQGMWKLADELKYAVHPFPSSIPDTGVQRERHMKNHELPYISKHIIAAIDFLKENAQLVLDKTKGSK